MFTAGITGTSRRGRIATWAVMLIAVRAPATASVPRRMVRTCPHASFSDVPNRPGCRFRYQWAARPLNATRISTRRSQGRSAAEVSERRASRAPRTASPPRVTASTPDATMSRTQSINSSTPSATMAAAESTPDRRNPRNRAGSPPKRAGVMADAASPYAFTATARHTDGLWLRGSSKRIRHARTAVSSTTRPTAAAWITQGAPTNRFVAAAGLGRRRPG